MKIFLLLVFITHAAFGALPLKGKGQADSSYYEVHNLQVPNSSITKVTPSTGLLETGNNNILVNPSFEHSTPATGWTLTSGSSAVETSVVKHGGQSLKITLSSQTLDFYQDSTRYQAQFSDGINGDRKIWVKTTVSGVYVCPRNAGSTIYSQCATVDSTGKWLEYNAPYVLGGTSNGIAVVSGTMSSGVVTPGNVTGDVYVDGEAYVGETKSLFGTPVITPWASYTPTFTSFGTPSTVSFRWRQVGSSIEVEGRATSGTTTSTEGRISLPNGYVIDASSPGTLSLVGSLIRTASSSTYFANSVLAEPGASYVVFGQQTSSSGAFAKIAACPVGNTESFTVKFSVPVANLAGSTQVFASACGVKCEDTFAAAVSSSNTIGTNDYSWVSSASWSSGVLTVNFTAGNFTVAPSCWAIPDAGNTGQRLVVNTTTSSAVTFLNRSNDGTANVNGDARVYCKKTGVDLVASRTIVGSFKGVPTTPGSVSPKLLAASINCDSSSAIVSQFGNSWISSIGNITSGQCAINLNSGVFNNTARCWAVNNNFTSGDSNNLGITVVPGSNVLQTTDCRSVTADCTVYDANFFCYGE